MYVPLMSLQMNRGRRYEDNCRKSQAAMDDILPGVIIDGVLGIDLNVTDEFKGQLDDLVFHRGNEAQQVDSKNLKKEV